MGPRTETHAERAPFVAHIPDGFLSPPVLVGTSVLSAAALGLAVRRSRHALEDRQAPLLGAAAAFVFAAQMLNFPVGAGTSVHLLGGVLLAVVVGPWSGMIALASVLVVQALLFQDGGITALGANTLNLAVLGAGGGWIVYRWLLGLVGTGPRRRLAAAATAAFATTAAAGVAVALQLGLSGLVPLRSALVVVGGAHLVVAAAEAALTAAILAALVRSRPDLLDDRPVTPTQRALAAAGLAALGLGLAAYRWASASPDALETATAGLGLRGQPLFPAPFAGYVGPVGEGWLVPSAGVAVALAFAWGVARLAGRGRQPRSVSRRTWPA